ncbi:MAG: hypothetical protein Q8S84_02045 [bacterium]|nr:hypothetical protein [bacterium]MDP3380337.1 hypothetical protein [bacterium]
MISTAPINDTLYLFPTMEQLKIFYDEDKKYILENKNNIKVVFSPDYYK